MRSQYKETHGIFYFQSHYLADISMKKLCHQSIAYITMEWRGQQHASKAVESTSIRRQGSNRSHISTDRMKKKMEEPIVYARLRA